MNPEDSTSLEEFRQFRKKVGDQANICRWGSISPKTKPYAFFGAVSGKTLFRRLVFENNTEGFQRILARARALKDQSGLRRMVFGMEPAGNSPKPRGKHLIRCGYPVVLVSGVAACENRKTLDGR